MLGEISLARWILPIVAALYIIALLVGFVLAGGLRNQRKHEWLIDFLLWLTVTPLFVGLSVFCLRASGETAASYPFVSLLTVPILTGLLQGAAMGGLKKFFKSRQA